MSKRWCATAPVVCGYPWFVRVCSVLLRDGGSPTGDCQRDHMYRQSWQPPTSIAAYGSVIQTIASFEWMARKFDSTVWQKVLMSGTLRQSRRGVSTFGSEVSSELRALTEVTSSGCAVARTVRSR